MTVVKIDGAYTTGHEYEREALVEDPWMDDLDEWWWQVVHPHTGDEVFERAGSYCEATILQTTDPAMVGKKYEWMD